LQSKIQGDTAKSALVAQLNRASDYGSEGSGFESLRVHSVRSSQSPSEVGIFIFYQPDSKTIRLARAGCVHQ
jgi:hypothetical protein